MLLSRNDTQSKMQRDLRLLNVCPDQCIACAPPLHHLYRTKSTLFDVIVEAPAFRSSPGLLSQNNMNIKPSGAYLTVLQFWLF